MEHSDSGRPRILIIDDMVINQMLLASQLGALHVEADVASSGEKGLALYQEKHYDLVLLDRHMPDMDGFETFEKLKDIFKEQNREVPVICETADDDAETAAKLKEAGFTEVLVKPIDFGELHDMMVRRLGDAYSEANPAQETTEEDIEAAYNELPDWLHSINGLDVRQGLKRCGGSVSDYMDALAIFAASINEKTKTVQYYLETNNERIHILRLHSLKSSARLVGAVTLAEQAAALEIAGKVGNTKALQSGTESLINHYRELEEQLKAHLGNGSGKAGVLPSISDETLHDMYVALDEAVRSEDKGNIETLLHSLEEYALDSENALRLERLKIADRKNNQKVLLEILSEVL